MVRLSVMGVVNQWRVHATVAKNVTSAFIPSCAELLHELQHPIHWKHPLILHKTPPYDGGTCTCNGCNLPCKKFIYHCPLCKSDLDIKCASLPPTIETEIHDHPLTLLRNSISFTCNVCGKEGKGMPYMCRM